MMATDFLAQLESMKEQGLVEPEQLSKDRVPRELKRGWLSLIDQLGQGAFGEVWKGLLADGENTSIPEFLVACKTVKAGQGMDMSAAAAAEEELLKEALLMAQVDNHVHLVSLVGVITRGRPKVLVLSFCEHGELQGRLKKRGADGDPVPTPEKLRYCKEIAEGMAHLAQHNFVHRDLAARNVLLGSGMVCKVADFGLSRRVQTDDNDGDYYRSSSGIVPVRWTAPEGLTSQKFSSASDVWSFGITCVEVFQDGAAPYPGVRSNPEVMQLVAAGEVHPCPASCSADVYRELQTCWAFDPASRPAFPSLAEFFAQQAACGEGEGHRDTRATQLGGSNYNLGADAVGQAGAYDLGFSGNGQATAPSNVYNDEGAEGLHSDAGGQAGAYDLGSEASTMAGAYDLGHDTATATAGSTPTPVQIIEPPVDTGPGASKARRRGNGGAAKSKKGRGTKGSLLGDALEFEGAGMGSTSI